jgi:hypothetical protein
MEHICDTNLPIVVKKLTDDAKSTVYDIYALAYHIYCKCYKWAPNVPTWAQDGFNMGQLLANL